MAHISTRKMDGSDHLSQTNGGDDLIETHVSTLSPKDFMSPIQNLPTAGHKKKY